MTSRGEWVVALMVECAICERASGFMRLFFGQKVWRAPREERQNALSLKTTGNVLVKPTATGTPLQGDHPLCSHRLQRCAWCAC